jgi:alkaline phosphatase
LLDEVKKKTKYYLALNSSQLHTAKSLPLLGLFAPTDLAYRIDQPKNGSQPGLLDMVDKALDLLYTATQHSDKGFFLFYESEVTDSAQHDNDLVGTISGAAEISDTAARVKKWVRKLNKRGDDTLFFSTSDHETGGLGLGSDRSSPVEAPWGWNRTFFLLLADRC